uniref:PIH1 N-terminal domain-containing protein n=1 Tax=Denticeps clupeoides TaxID=299321 RepID=A0AAY4B2I2_9TELE
MEDDRFHELMRDYIKDISNTENWKKYEGEIKMLELERDVDIQFIHPTPYRVIKSRLEGEQKCFINICSNELIKAPEFKAAMNKNGKLGQFWSLPCSLTPGRTELNSKGKQHMTYDVMFHPDILKMASTNGRFMWLVDSTAVKAIQNAFKVQLDRKTIKVLKIKYKGVPIYTVKYRSVIDLQDFTCSRDSGPGPRPRDIIITINLPLLRSAADADLEVSGERLLLISHTPAYKLDLNLAYPVDESNATAVFNKGNKQLTVTLPVLTPKENLDVDM